MTAPSLFGDQLEPDEALALPCFQNPGPWQDSVKAHVQKWAEQKCKALCGQRVWCERQRLAAVAEFGIALGVWAGQTYRYKDYDAASGHRTKSVPPDGTLTRLGDTGQ